MSKQEPIKNMDRFYEKYLPEDAKKYPITMRVSEKEADFLRGRREEWQPRKEAGDGI